MSVLLVIMVGFLLGSIPFGVLLARLFGLPDPRDIGSGNIGATNMVRAGRKDIAALTLMLDGLKAVAAVLMAGMIAPAYASLGLLAAIAGHIYSPWLGFKGGKGVACAMGGLFALAPLTGLITCSVWLIIFFSTRISSLSALIALLFAPFILWWDSDAATAIIFMLAVALVMYRHKENIDRLLRAQEPRFEFGSSKTNETE